MAEITILPWSPTHRPRQLYRVRATRKGHGLPAGTLQYCLGSYTGSGGAELLVMRRQNGEPAFLPASMFEALEDLTPQPSETGTVAPYDAGLLNDHGGGDVGWWHDYIRALLAGAHDHYVEQIGTQP